MAVIDDYAITIDIDWAPDWVIEYVAGVLNENNVRATWFVTHRSAAVERLRDYSSIFEFGIHPNMLAGSTHGKTEDEVLAHVKDIIPEAISMRTHGLYQSTNFLAKAAGEYGIAIDVSLFLPGVTHIVPHTFRWGGVKLWRVPYFWEDDSEMFETSPNWELSGKKINDSGLKIFNFHPIHIVLNTCDYESYVELQQKLPLKEWDKEFVKKHANRGSGTKSFFLQLADELRGRGKRIRDIVAWDKR